ncbi:iron complex transport system ATP-binding protein [Ochrobactrum daejeonense]|uniref:Iron complex transport system ATP-binding protein n=1 Tax=Brucella daejeonensis TaxID=659015 RepID=A0A7W9ELU3_9HYPH|nr:heme ABC transporter ATP-binding protein [Brucella daejeonensis]MBB5702719.1 iron complex transport system ATP-binding protein [Brucella daejeonensis]
MIETKALSVSLSGKTIIRDIAFSARRGEVTAIVGPNGSGKTTLLRALSGDIPFTGSAYLDGRSFAAIKPWEMASRRAVLPQASALSFPFTVREIVKIGLTGGYSGVSRQEEKDLPDMALHKVDLDGFGGRLYQELSGGEQQRVQLARVLCQVWKPVVDGEARYLFLDEPISSLDIRHQIVVMEIARDFAMAGGGVVAVLHDLNLTAMFADRIAVMNKGRLDTMGSPQDTLTDERLERIYECSLRVGVSPEKGVPFILPQSVRASQ